MPHVRGNFMGTCPMPGVMLKATCPTYVRKISWEDVQFKK
jgi:hypothetical protein